MLLLIFASSIFGANIIKPSLKYEADGAVVDIVYDSNKLYVSTSASVVDIFDITTNKIIKKIKIPKIKDFMGDIIDSKIYSVDVLRDEVLVLSQGEHGFRNIDIEKNDKLTSVISTKDKLYIAKAKFINKDTIIFALLSNDLISYDIRKKKENWSIQVSQSKFSNFVLSEDKKEVVTCDESGDLHIIDINNGKVKKTLSGKNLDNVFQVDYKNGIIATAGQDRRIVIYNLKTGSSYYKTATFLIYGVGLSPSGKIAGYANDEDNNVELFKTASKTKIGLFGENKMTITNILFLNETEFFISTDDKTINYYKLK